MVVAPCVLIAEDDDIFRDIVRLLLHRFRPHFRLLEARNGQEAYALYQQHGADLILTDDQMPVMRGTELIHTLRVEQHTTPIVLLSSQPIARTAISDDAHTVVAMKPMPMNDLLVIIDRLLGVS